jgi:biotin carboxyl carrier protein
LAFVSEPSVTVTRIANGTYRVEHAGRNEIVYVAGLVADRWIFWNGQVFRAIVRASEAPGAAPDKASGQDQRSGAERVRPAAAQSLVAPMPARVLKVLVEAGSTVKKGDTLIVLEAMKMELPIRAPALAVVTAVHCREGELVPADAVLIDLK